MNSPGSSGVAASALRAATVIVIVVSARQALPVLCAASTPAAQSSAKQKSTQSRSQKLSNPLNDLLEEAQHDIDNNQFEAALTPLQKFLAEKPDMAWAHFQLAYAYTVLKRSDEARAEYERATSLDPKMSEAFLNLGILLSEKKIPPPPSRLSAERSIYSLRRAGRDSS